MSVRIATVSPTEPDPGAVKEAVAVLRAGGLVVLPTETVYGIAARLSDAAAVTRLRELKGRPETAPFPVQAANAGAATALLQTVPLAARPLMKLFWPGPLTIVFPHARISAGGEGLGVRVPAHAVPEAVMRELGEPLVVPSCNARGAPPAVDGTAAAATFPAGVGMVLDAGPTSIREASTVVRVGEDDWEILREGLVSRDMLCKVIGRTTYLFVCTGNTCRSPMGEALARQSFAAHVGLTPAEVDQLGVQFVSAGIEALSGRGASRGAREAMREIGLDLTAHRTRPLSAPLVRTADRIVCMEGEHRVHVLALDPDAGGKTVILGPDGVADPAGGTLAEYRAARDAIRAAVGEVLGIRR